MEMGIRSENGIVTKYLQPLKQKQKKSSSRRSFGQLVKFD